MPSDPNSTTECPILWQNHQKTVTLIDIPHSIAAAQGTKQHPRQCQIISSNPLQNPYPSNEPKSAAARAKLEKNTVDGALHKEYKEILCSALEEIQSHHQGEWCSSRPWRQDATKETKKRKLDWSEGLPDMTPQLIQAPEGGARMMLLKNPQDGDVHIATRNETSNIAVQENSPLFYIPSNSCCFLGDCSDVGGFHESVSAQAQCNGTGKEFDFILLDPPWPNRSVKRTHNTPGSTYATAPNLTYLRQLLLGMDLDKLMADECLVGIWITNKPAISDFVLGRDGLFDSWQLDLIEEWIWLKTTVHGEPVTQLNALWRKPYEVLLLGRRRKQGNLAPRELNRGRSRRRVIVGVPDLHSRKPCLKAFVEPLMSNSADYRALEVFARHLVAGWWSWGKESIKFNWEGYWKQT